MRKRTSGGEYCLDHSLLPLKLSRLPIPPGVNPAGATAISPLRGVSSKPAVKLRSIARNAARATWAQRRVLLAVGLTLIAFEATAGVIQSDAFSTALPAERVLTDILHIERDGSQQRANSESLVKLEDAVKHFRKRDYDSALDSFRSARTVSTDLAPAELMLARLFFADGQIDAGRRALEQVAANAPEDPEVYLVFGELALFDGRLTDALLNFQHAGQLATDKPLSAKQTSIWHSGLVSVAERRLNWQLAEQRLAAWLIVDPQNSKLRQRFARVLFEQQRDDEAAKMLTAAREHDPNLEPVALIMGRWHHAAGRAESAEQWMAAALMDHGDDPRVRVGAIHRSLEHDRPDEAQQHLDQLAKLQPDHADLLWLSGLVARFRRDYQAAEKCFQDLLLDNPAGFAASNQLALVLIEQTGENARRRALQLAELNVRQNQKSPEALATLGWVYYRLHRLEEAEQVLQPLLASGRLSPEAAYYVARLMADRGRSEEALRLFQEAAQAEGLFPHRAACRSEVSHLQAAQPAATKSTLKPRLSSP